MRRVKKIPASDMSSSTDSTSTSLGGLKATLGSRKLVDGADDKDALIVETPLSKNFATQFAFDLDSIILPEKICFDDYLSTRPAKKIDLSGWMISAAVFKTIGAHNKQKLHTLLLDDCIGFNAKMLETIRGFPKLKVLHMKNVGLTLTFQAGQVLGSLSRLVDLDISDSTVDVTSFSIICNTCQHLKTLVCQNCKGMDDFCLQALASCMQRFRRLQCVDLSRGSSYSDEGFLTVLTATPKLLTRLNMANCHNLSSLAITALRNKMPALTYLDLSHLRLSQTCYEWVTEGCNNLETLILNHCENLDDRALVKIGSKCLVLKKLVCNQCLKLTDAGIVGFFEGMTKGVELGLCGPYGGLKYFDISSNIDCKEASVLALAKYESTVQRYYPNQGLICLKMNGLSYVTAVALMAMWKACTDLAYFEMKLELSQTVTHRKSMMPHISDSILIQARYHLLQGANLSGCCLISDEGICNLVEKCTENLRELDISYCGLCTDLTLFHLAEFAGPRLKKLNVSGCNRMTNKGIIALATDSSLYAPKSRTQKNINGNNDEHGNHGEKEEDGPELIEEGSLHGMTSVTASMNSAGMSEYSAHSHLFGSDNKYPYSVGCLGLECLEMNGLHKVTDAGIVAIASNLLQLTTLSIRNLEHCTDSPFWLVAENLRHLKNLNIASIDMIGLDVVTAIAQKCYKLESFSCDLCNFTPLEFAKALRPILPLAMPDGLRSKVEPRPRPILEYNRFVVDTLEKRLAAYVITKFGQYCICWVRQRTTKRARAQARETIKTVWYAYLDRNRLFWKWRVKNAQRRAANILQKWWKRMEGCLAAKWKVRRQRRVDRATRLLQRFYRGHRVRKRQYRKFAKVFYFYNKIGHLAWKYRIILAAREFHRKHVLIQSVGRMFPQKLNYILFRRAITTLQIRAQNYMRTRRQVRRCMVWMISSLEGHSDAANVIRKNWRIKMFNKHMSKFIFICACYWRAIEDEKDWRVVQLQAWLRGAMVRLRVWRIRDYPMMLERMATRVQATWWMMKSRRQFYIMRRKRKRETQFFRIVTSKCCRLRLGRITRKIQKVYKLRYFNLQRAYSAYTIQRFYRGYCARKDIAAVKQQYLCRMATKIQKCWRAYAAWKVRREIHARRHMAAWKIQYQIHGFFDIDGQRRIQAKTAARRRREELAEKMRLLTISREGALERRKQDFMNIFARRIQKRWRRYSNNKRRKAEALLNRAKLQEDMQEEAVTIQSKRFLARIGNPLVGLQRMFTSAWKVAVQGGQLITKDDEPRLTNAILKYHTVSIVQFGIVDLHLTVGDPENQAFTLSQNVARTSGKPYFEKIDVDLSTIMRMKVYLWVRKGKGKDCITSLTVEKKPDSMSAVELTSRAGHAKASNKIICWHPYLHFEFRADQSIKDGKGGFGVNDIQISLTEDEAENLELKGYRLAKDLTTFGFNCSVWIYAKMPAEQDDIFKLGALEKQVWCDKRLLKIIYTYNMTSADIYGLRSVFDSILGTSMNETIMNRDVMKYVGTDPDTEIPGWFIQSIEPKRKKELIFSEYVHFVCSICMMGKKDLRRFLFGKMDFAQNAFLKRDQFITLIEHMSVGTVYNPNIWMMQYDNFKDRKLDSLFYGGFEEFCESYRAVTWSTEYFQQAVRAKNLGAEFWLEKMATFHDMREMLGVKLV